MIVQISMIRNELPLIKELLPIWSKYADGFVFYLDTTTDGSLEYLQSVKDQYNILEVLNFTHSDDELKIETDSRQLLFDTAKKYSDHIICLDADEYLDGEMTKAELQNLLSNTTDSVFYLKWVQYTSVNTIRIDGPWGNNWKDRIGSYKEPVRFAIAQSHSTHLPVSVNQMKIDSNKLYIAHLQWLDKTFVAIKQYYWKVFDYVNNKLYGVSVAGNAAYDSSVNNFQWEEEYTNNLLKINPYIFEKTAVFKNYRLEYIKENTQKYNIPNLGDWGKNILEIDNTIEPEVNPYKISVITAIGPIQVYGKFINRYVNNVIKQHFFNQTEHIIVYSEWHDDFNQFRKYPNFKLIKEDEQKGVYNAWNIGIQAATTDYVTNWNIDDIRHPINTKIKYDAITRNDSDVIYNWYFATYDERLDFDNIEGELIPTVRFPDNYEKYATQACLIGPDPLWKKSLHEKVGYFDYENFNTIGDWEMWARFAKAGAKFNLIEEVLCIYLDHTDTVSKKNLHKAEIEKHKLYEKYK